MPLLIHAAGEKAAVHREQVSGDEARRLGREKNRGARDFVRLTEAPHRRAHQELAAAIGAVEQPFVERRSEHTRQNRVDAHAVRRPLDRERFRERGHARLARPVRGDFVQRDDRCERSDVDDASVTPLDHVASEDAAGTQHPGEVRVHDLIPLGVRDLERGAPHRAARRVHQDVDLAELLDRCVGERLEGIGIRYVRRHRERASSASFDLARRLFGQLRPTTRRDDVGAGVGQPERDRLADARSRADDDGGAPC